MDTRLSSLPVYMLEKILLYLRYEEIAKLRYVSQMFNNTCMSLLNQGFRAAEKFHAKYFKEVKTKLPRRESERRAHKLARHCDILVAIETRISLLGMTFLKYIDANLCCFIPGKVIDEIFSVLRCIQGEETPPRAYEILQELRDISSMAMEHFDENIAPTLQLPFSPGKFGSSGFSLTYPGTPTGHQICPRVPASEPARASKSLLVPDVTTDCGSDRKLIKSLKRKSNSFKATVNSQNRKIVKMDMKINQQDETIQQQNNRLSEQDEKLAEMSRRLAGMKRAADDQEDGSVPKKMKLNNS